MVGNVLRRRAVAKSGGGGAAIVKRIIARTRIQRWNVCCSAHAQALASDDAWRQYRWLMSRKSAAWFVASTEESGMVKNSSMATLRRAAAVASSRAA